MRKVTLALTLALCLVSTFTFGVSAHTVQHVLRTVYPNELTPNSTGGGCSGYKKSPLDDIEVDACISYSTGYVRPDGYANFKPLVSQYGQVSSCETAISLYDASIDTLINSSPLYDCTNAAIRRYTSVHYYGITYKTNSGRYYSYMFATIHYQGGEVSTGVASSPIVYV